MREITIGQYHFLPAGAIQYPDGDIIDLNKINPLNIGMMHDENWVVTLLTQATLYKYCKKSNKTLEVLGFRFDDQAEAFLAHNILVNYFFRPDEKEDNVIE